MPHPTTRNRIPPLLELYLHLPRETTLILLTGILNASANWLVVKYLSALLVNDAWAHRNQPDKKASVRGEELTPRENADRELVSGPQQNETVSAGRKMRNELENESRDEYGVVLVSWMRDWEFWSMEGRKVGGLDLQSLARQKRFVFVDCLTGLFDSPSNEKSASEKSQQASTSSTTLSSASKPPASSPTATQPSPNLPSSGLSQRTPPPPRHPPGPQPQSKELPPKSSSRPHILNPPNPSIPALKSTIEQALTQLSSPTTCLILDTPSLLLSTTPPIASSPLDLTHSLLSLLPTLTPQPTHLIISDLADGPFLRPTQRLTTAHDASLSLYANHSAHSVGGTGVSAEAASGDGGVGSSDPISLAHATWIASLAHRAQLVLACRPLASGTARDVSGVVRAGRGGGLWDLGGGGGGEGGDGGSGSEGRGGGGRGEWYDGIEERELLYHLGNDGVVKVFRRGEE
ncbi:MAG: hypothetical protein Q9165_008014 [Trypethelium subeluteriae]